MIKAVNLISITGLLLSGLITMTAPAFARPLSIEPFVIYGDDNRLNLYQVKEIDQSRNPESQLWLNVAQSTVVLVEAKNIETHSESQTAKINTIPFKHEYELCEDEPFREEGTGGFCSGTLIGPDLILTAGHCIESEEACHNTKFIFGFALQHANDVQYQQRPLNEIYGCHSIVKQQLNDDGLDFAIIRLDRSVTGHTPIALRTEGRIESNSLVTLIGYPSGIPVKVAPNARIRENDATEFFVASTDSYGGNSGSAVINQMTGVIEGVLVRGEQDFKFDGSCWRSNRCAETGSGCRGEDVVRASRIAPYLPTLIQ